MDYQNLKYKITFVSTLQYKGVNCSCGDGNKTQQIKIKVIEPHMDQ